MNAWRKAITKSRVLFILLFFLVVAFSALDMTNAASACRTTSHSSYSVQLCIDAPADGAVVHGPITVNVSVTRSDTSIGVSKLIFYLDTEYLLTDFEEPFTFKIPTEKFVDGTYTLLVEAHMRDGFVTNRPSIALTFDNGITEPPVNLKTFTPHTSSPAPGQPYIVAATGDGAGGEWPEVTDLIASWDPDMFLYLGDVYDQGTATEFYNWYGAGTEYFGQFRAITNPTVGNHEYLSDDNASGYFDYWDNVPHYYSFDAAGWHFISLEEIGSDFNHLEPGGAQYDWLVQDLTNNTSPCTIIYLHQPIFTRGPQETPTTDNPNLSYIWPLMAQYDVEAVLTGHEHNYQRWFPLDTNGNQTSEGTVQFVLGAGGHGVRSFSLSDNRAAAGYDTSPGALGALRLELRPDRLTFEYVNIFGTVLDSGTITCIGVPTPPAPTLVAPANGVTLTDNTPYLDWNNAKDAESYTIQLDIVATFNSNNKIVGFSNTSNFTPGSSLPDETWYWRVRGLNSLGKPGPWSEVRHFTLDTSAINLSAPTLLTPSNGSIPTSIAPTFTWKAVTNAGMYQIHIDNNTNFTSPMQNAIVGKTRYDATSLVNGLYYWRVRALSVTGKPGPWSAIWAFTIDTTRPILLAPPDGSLTNVAIPTFEWEAVPEVVKYNIQIDDNDDFSSTRYNANVFNKTTFKPFLGLGNGTWYWRVRVQMPNGEWGSWSATWTVMMDRVRPARPTLTSPAQNEEVATSTPVFKWETDPEAATYTLQIDKNFYFRGADQHEYAGIGKNQFEIPDSLEDGLWFWRVKATDAAGNDSFWSAINRVVVDAIETPVPMLVAPVPPVLTRDRVFDFAWTAETGVSRYNIQINSSIDFDGIMRVNAKPIANAFRNAFQPLSNGVWYWRVSALGTDGIWGDWSEPWQIEVDLLRPDRPVLTAPALDEIVQVDSPTFEWVNQFPDAVAYILQVDRNSYFRSPDLHTYEGIDTNAFTISDTLFDGRWFWRVAALDAVGNQSFWSPNSRVFVDAITTPVPKLVSPANSTTPQNDAVYDFTWTAEPDVARYNIQVNSALDFTGVMRVNAKPMTNAFRNNFQPLPTGTWYWRVSAQGSDGIWGAWSAPYTLVVDRTKPGRPMLQSPATGSTTSDNTPKLSWLPVGNTDVVNYMVQIDTYFYFVSPNKLDRDAGLSTSLIVDVPLSDRRWFWRVAAVDEAGNVGSWSQVWNFVVNTGASSSTTQVIQSDSPQVQRAGQWQRYNLGGGSYLASSNDFAALSLTFTGSQIEVVYAKQASLGTFAIEIDGVVVQTVNSRTPNMLKLARVAIPVTPGEHAVRLVTVKGSVVIDAFVVTP